MAREGIAGGGKRVGEILPHPDLLRALAGAHQHDVTTGRRRSPQVKPGAEGDQHDQRAGSDAALAIA